MISSYKMLPLVIEGEPFHAKYEKTSFLAPQLNEHPTFSCF